jgi:hypothetical protein
MTPRLDAPFAPFRVLGVLLLVAVIVGLWQHQRLERIVTVGAAKAVPNVWASFWRWAALGAVVFALISFLPRRSTGVHLSLALSILPGFVAFAMFVGVLAVMYFVGPRYRARAAPRDTVRASLALLAAAGIVFVAVSYL